MWENKILILDIEKIEQTHSVFADEVQLAFFLEQKLDKFTHEGWEPYHVTDHADNDDLLIVWMKRYNPDL